MEAKELVMSNGFKAWIVVCLLAIIGIGIYGQRVRYAPKKNAIPFLASHSEKAGTSSQVHPRTDHISNVHLSDVAGKQADWFEYPFLGRLATRSNEGLIRLKDNTGNDRECKVKVHTTERGRFVGIEYLKDLGKRVGARVEVAEANFKAAGDTIAGLPEDAPKISVRELLEKLHDFPGGNFEDSTRFTVAYVMLAQSGRPASPTFIVNVWGTLKLSDKLPDEPVFYRARFLFDAMGELCVIDDVL